MFEYTIKFSGQYDDIAYEYDVSAYNRDEAIEEAKQFLFSEMFDIEVIYDEVTELLSDGYPDINITP